MTYSPDSPDEVRELFGFVAPRYDLLNTLISFGAHKRWRRFAARLANLQPGQTALDVGCGTGDMSLALGAGAARCTVVGLDFAPPMLRAFCNKAARGSRRLGCTLYAVCGDALVLPSRDESFDAVTIAFGLRNIPDRRKALAEFRRAMKPWGHLVVLDAAEPRNRLARMLFSAHFRFLVPLIGWLFTRRWGLYAYLPASLEGYLSPEELADLMRDSGFVDVRWFGLAFGAASVHVGAKE